MSLLLISASALGDLPRFLFGFAFRERLLILVDAAVVGLALQVSRTDACFVIREFFAFLRPVLMDFRPAFVRVALGALGRDVPAARVVLAAVARRRFPGAAVSVADSAAYSVVVPVTRSLKHSVSCDCLTVSGRSYTCKHRRDLSVFPLASKYTVSIAKTREDCEDAKRDKC